MDITHRLRHAAPLVACGALLVACGGDGSDPIPQLAAATPASFTGDCATLQAMLAGIAPQTTITLAETVPAGTVGGATTGEHCRLTGRMNPRTGPIDGQPYAIGFEVRAPRNWNGRFFLQANGGTDGNVATATGAIGGAGATETALSRGFAVLSSDAGHSGGTPFFGIDPQARIDYGYNAVAQLTPMAKNLLKAVYGKAPDRSYLGGCSNGGRHAMVAAVRFAEQYDGILAGNPGFNLPASALAQMWGAQQFGTVATQTVTVQVPQPGGGTAAQTFPNVGTAFTNAELATVSAAVVQRCDALDGATDQAVNDFAACQSTFQLERDVPTCTGARDGSCLDTAQKSVLGRIFAGMRNSAGQALYADWPFDPGVRGSGWRQWKFSNAVNLSPGAAAFVFATPPQATQAGFSALAYAMAFNVDTDAARIFATDATYTESAVAFMTPPASDLAPLRNRGAKLMVYHGVADPTFSFNDTAGWFRRLDAANDGGAAEFARLYAVPGMNHCSGGPATDSFDMLAALVDWVERGVAPDRVVASARAGNTELPAGWSPTRTRPLCPWPQVARYTGTGDLESASSFRCQ